MAIKISNTTVIDDSKQLANISNYNTTSTNFFAGQCAGYSNVTGCNNTFIGNQTGKNTCTSNNIAVGFRALESKMLVDTLNTSTYNPGSGYTPGQYQNITLSLLSGTAPSVYPVVNINVDSKSSTIWIVSVNQSPVGGGLDTVYTVNNSLIGGTGSGFSINGFRFPSGGNNTAVGYYAGNSITTGSNNNFMGYCAGYCNATGNDNNFMGSQAGFSNTTGGCNNFIGYFAGYANTTGQRNNFMGSQAGFSNTTGGCNNFIGYFAGYANTTGQRNNFMGFRAGYNNTTGGNNNFMGNSAGYCNTTGNNNNFMGSQAGFSNTTGYSNNFMGVLAGYSNITGGNNNFMGTSAGYYNTTGNNNNFMGNGAGRFNTTGYSNNFMGVLAGYSNITGNDNNFMGSQAGFSNTTGGCNNFIGYQAGFANTSGNNNNLIGNCAGFCNTTGVNNFFAGTCAGYNVTTGSNNTIIGGALGTTGLSDTVIIAAGSTERIKVDATGLSINGTPFTGGGGGTADLSNVNQDIIPVLSEVYDIGSTDKRWFDVNVSNSININGSSLIAANDVISTTSDLVTNSLLAGDVLISDNLITPDNSTAQQYLGEKGVLIVNGNLEIDGDWAALPSVKTGLVYTAANSGLLDTNFTYTIESDVYQITVQTDGKILISGRYDWGFGQIVRLNTDGSRDTNFTIGKTNNSYDNEMKVQPDGKILIGGDFTSYNGTTANRIVRLNTDGSIDTSFNTGTGFSSTVRTIAVQSNGKILVGGYFTSYNGTTANRIVRLNTDGSIDTSFNSGIGTDYFIYTIATQSNGKILVGGQFTSYNGTTSAGLVRLNTDGSIDTSFNSGIGTDYSIYTIATQSDGKILVGGSFTSYNGTTANCIVRLNTDGSIDTSFVTGTGFNLPAQKIVVQSDGKILVGGSFTSYNGTTANRIVRLNTDGSIDTSFNTGTGFSSYVTTMAIENQDTGILVGGYFTAYNQQSAIYVTRIKSGYSMSYPLTTGKEGLIRYNQDIKSLQAYNGSRWDLLERVITPPTTLAVNGTVNIDFSGAPLSIQGNLTGNINYTARNYTAGSTITILVKNGSSTRTVAFPSNWIFVGEKPTTIAANKKAILTVTSFGATEEDCVAAWAVQQ